MPKHLTRQCACACVCEVSVHHTNGYACILNHMVEMSWNMERYIHACNILRCHSANSQTAPCRMTGSLCGLGGRIVRSPSPGTHGHCQNVCRANQTTQRLIMIHYCREWSWRKCLPRQQVRWAIPVFVLGKPKAIR